MRPTEALNNS